MTYRQRPSRRVHRKGPSGLLFLVGILLSMLAARSCPADSAPFHPRLGTYHYRVELSGAKAADASLTIAVENGEYLLTARVRAVKLIDRFYRLRYEGESRLTAMDLQPLQTVLRSREGSRRKETSIDYEPGGRIEAVEVRRKGKGLEKKKIREFQFDTVVLDPFAAVFLARRVVWAPGVVQRFEVFTGRDRYRVDLECAGEIGFDLPSGARAAWLIVPEIENLTRPDKKPRVEDTRIYLSADSERELLGLTSRAFIGEIGLRLSKFEPSPMTGGAR